MALDASRVRVALTGHVWFRPKGVDGDEPTTPTGTIPGAYELGYTSEDGVVFNQSMETEDIFGWQTTSPLRRLITQTPRSCSFTLMQASRETWLTALGGKITQTASGVYMWEPDDSSMVEGELYVDFEDGDLRYRFGYRRASQSGEVEMNLVRSGALTFPTEWTALATDDGRPGWFVLTNDPAFAESSTSGGTSPAPTAATTATAGTPGTFNGATPANLGALATVTASPTSAWTTGQSIKLADDSSAHWDGSAWKAGTAA